MASQRVFTFPSTLPTWHLGHMAKAIRNMKIRMKEVDVVIETRDARLPLTSINPIFEEIFKAAPSKKNDNQKTHSNPDMPVRLIVYNKKDLANHLLEKPLGDAFKKQGQTVFFTDSRINEDVRRILHLSGELARPRLLSRYGRAEPSSVELSSDGPDQSIKTRSPKTPTRSPPSDQTKGIKIMFCGMPNVGKSSLLNALRRVGCHKGKAAPEAPMPGHTRSVGGMIKISDGSKRTIGWPVYAFDTPGIMLPYLGNGQDAADRAFKMAITAMIKESLFDSYDLAAYLFHTLARILPPMEAPSVISKALQLPQDSDLLTKLADPSQPLPTQDLLSAIADRIKAVQAGGLPNTEAAARWMLKCFRDGKFGGWTLDDVGQTTTNTSQPSESSILNLIKSTSTVDQSLEKSSNQSEQTNHDYTQIDGYISHYLASNHATPKSKTAIKLQAKRDRREIQRNLQKNRRK